jgi:predicted acyltransferase
MRVGSGGSTVSLKGLIYTKIFDPIPDPSFGTLLYSLSCVLVCFVVCLVLYRRRIFIKI